MQPSHLSGPFLLSPQPNPVFQDRSGLNIIPFGLGEKGQEGSVDLGAAENSAPFPAALEG